MKYEGVEPPNLHALTVCRLNSIVQHVYVGNNNYYFIIILHTILYYHQPEVIIIIHNNWANLSICNFIRHN